MTELITEENLLKCWKLLSYKFQEIIKNVRQAKFLFFVKYKCQFCEKKICKCNIQRTWRKHDMWQKFKQEKRNCTWVGQFILTCYTVKHLNTFANFVGTSFTCFWKRTSCLLFICIETKMYVSIKIQNVFFNQSYHKEYVTELITEENLLKYWKLLSYNFQEIIKKC